MAIQQNYRGQEGGAVWSCRGAGAVAGIVANLRSARLFKAIFVVGFAVLNTASPAFALPPQTPEQQVLENTSRERAKSTETRMVGGISIGLTEESPPPQYLNDNGQNLIVSVVYGFWAGQMITGVNHLSETVETNSGRSAIDSKKLGALEFGSGSEDVTVFVDPQCPPCHALLRELSPMAGKYHIRIFVLPVLGEESARRTRLLACAQNHAASLEVLLASSDPSDLLQQPGCSLSIIAKWVLLAGQIGINAVPTIISPDGRAHSGAPDDLAAFLSPRRPKL